MKQICTFCSDSDLVRHRPNLTVDINRVFEDGVIPVGGTNPIDFPDTTDTDMIGERLTNVFDAIEYEKAVAMNIDKYNYSSGASQNITPQSSPSQSTLPEGGAE